MEQTGYGWALALLAVALLALGALVPAASAQTGCGGVLQPPCPEATPSPTPSPAPTPSPSPSPSPDSRPDRLTPRQFRALERLLEAGVANDKPKPTPRAAARFARQCKALGRHGAALAAYRRLCTPIARVLVFINRGCDTPASCRRQFAVQARTARAIVRAAPKANAALERALAPGPCRRELTLSRSEIRAERASVGLLAKYARLYGRVSDKRLRQIYRNRRDEFRAARGPQEQLRGLRRNCG